MGLSRTDLVPVLAIICGGAVGVLTSASLLLSSLPDYVSAYASAPVRPAASPDQTSNVFLSHRDVRVLTSEVERFRPVLSPDGQRLAYRFQVAASSEPHVIVRSVPGTTDRQSGFPLIYVDGVRMDAISFLEGLNPDDIESIEVVRGDEAVSLYGPEVADGVIRISLR